MLLFTSLTIKKNRLLFTKERKKKRYTERERKIAITQKGKRYSLSKP